MPTLLMMRKHSVHISVLLGKKWGNISVSNEDVKVLSNLQITEGYIKLLLEREIFLDQLFWITSMQEL